MAHTTQSNKLFVDTIMRKPSNAIILKDMLSSIQQQQKTMQAYKNQNPTIERHRSIPKGTRADYIFAINVLYAIKDADRLLDTMDEHLSSDGKILIIDYRGRGNNLNARFRNTIPIRLFEQYFISILRK